MKSTTINRVLSGPPRGSSRPILVDTPLGVQLVKLRGAAQGTGALVAEIIAGELATALELPVLPRCLVELVPTTPTDDQNDELADLLAASCGVNLAFPMLADARDANVEDLNAFSPRDRAAALWLDRFVLNLDRTKRNPNVLFHQGRSYFIDFGAALRFQYNWDAVTDETPCCVAEIAEHHLFESMSESDEWPAWESSFASRITVDVVRRAVSHVPDCFLIPLLANQGHGDLAGDESLAVQQRREDYVSFLLKRLTPPRRFATEPPQLRKQFRSGRPSWLEGH
jgi:hypothetical protein